MTTHTVKAFLLISLLLLSSCGYETTRKGVSINGENVSNIAIPTFHNTTTIAGVEAHMTQALRNSAMNNGNFDLTSRELADIVLHGEIISVGDSVLALNRIGSATEYRLTIGIRFTVKNNSSNQEIYADSVTGTWDYRYTDNTIDNRLAKNEATINLCKQLAQEILLLIRERFSNTPHTK